MKIIIEKDPPRIDKRRCCYLWHFGFLRLWTSTSASRKAGFEPSRPTQPLAPKLSTRVLASGLLEMTGRFDGRHTWTYDIGGSIRGVGLLFCGDRVDLPRLVGLLFSLSLPRLFYLHLAHWRPNFCGLLMIVCAREPVLAAQRALSVVQDSSIMSRLPANVPPWSSCTAIC